MLDIIVNGKVVMRDNDDNSTIIYDKVTAAKATAHMTKEEKAKFISDNNISFKIGE